MGASAAPFTTRLLEEPQPDDGQNTVEALLPASFRTESDHVVATDSDVSACVKRELNLDRPRQIGTLLWLAGRARRPRPLHYQIVVSREVFIAEQMDMHLVRTKTQILIKPLPRYLLEPVFWSKYLACDEGCACRKLDDGSEAACERRKDWKVALGFLASYAALIAHESDLTIAQQKFLVPAEVRWPHWRKFAGEILLATASNDSMDGRFHYGELSLERLSKMYRLWQPRAYGDYLLQWRHYSPFVSNRFRWLATATVYMALVLGAMQVGLGTERLSKSGTFQAASYGFVVFAILGPVIIMVALALEACYVGVTNGMATWAYSKRRLKKVDSVP